MLIHVREKPEPQGIVESSNDACRYSITSLGTIVFHIGTFFYCRDRVIPGELSNTVPDSKIHGTNVGPTWGRQDPGGPHAGHSNLAIWGVGWYTGLLRRQDSGSFGIDYVG